MTLVDVVSRMLAPLKTRIANMVARSVVELVDDSTRMQLLQVSVLADETRDGIERFQNYGFTGVPLAGAEAVVIFAGGRRDHGLAIAVDDRRYRIRNLESGEVAVYTDQGDSIVLKRGGTIEVTAATKVILNTPIVELGQPALDAAVKGTTYRAAEDVMVTALNSWAAAFGVYTGAIAAVADPTTAATPAITAATTALTTALGTFTGGAASYLSTKVKVG